MICWLVLGGFAAEPEADLNGDVKSFFVTVIPYDYLLMPLDPYGQAVVDGRLKLLATAGDWSVEVHQTATAIAAPDQEAMLAERMAEELGALATFATGAASAEAGAADEQAVRVPSTFTGVGQQAPEAVDLSWRLADTGPRYTFQGRIDRAVVRASLPGFDLAVGRQAVTLGSGVMFTPMDLVNPFHPATIDQEYKPGVDAVRFDAYAGMSSQLTAVAAYAGDWSLDGTVLALVGRATVGVTDLTALAAAAHGDAVLGAGTVSALGPVGVHGDITFTLTSEDDPLGPGFVRAVVGADGRPTGNTTISTELYLQSFGAGEPAGYLDVAATDRFARGEIWQMGRTYAALALSQQITPLLTGSAAVISNVEDPSALIVPSLAWSVAGNADVVVGGYTVAGARPDEVDPLDLVVLEGTQLTTPDDLHGRLGLTSEFGLYPTTLFVQMKAYF